jgi:ketosteroid isomerase-like protein
MLKKPTIAAFTVLAGSSLIALGQEPDRSPEAGRIRSVIAELNKAFSRSDAVAISRFFTPDGDLRIGRFVATGRAAIVRAIERQRSVWGEITPPFIETQSVQFVSLDVALVDASQTQFGSVILKRTVPVILLMKLDGKEWRILSMWLFLRSPYPVASPLPDPK